MSPIFSNFDKFPNPLPDFPEWWTNDDEEIEDN